MSSESDSLYDNFEDILRKISNEIAEKIEDFVKDKNYGSEVEELSVISIIVKFDEQMEKEGWFKERVLFKKKKKETDIRLRIDYDKFVKGDENTKKLLLIDNVINSIRQLSKKAKTSFNAKQLEDDILNLFNLTITDLEKL
jgi:hypothetical protein